jgi:hypothetical protein
VTGVNSVDTQALSVVGGKNRVEVIGADYMQIYDMTGNTIYQGKAGNYPLSSGFYIVKADNHTFKVVVR